MKISFGADMRNPVTDYLVEDLRNRGHDVAVHGPPADQPLEWVDVGSRVAEEVASGKADQGIVCCWTGTGVSIAANKIAGARAALCTDAETARGARWWDDANVLAMGLRTTTEALAKEMLDAWFKTTDIDPEQKENLEKIRRLESRTPA